MLEKVKKWCREQALIDCGDAVVIACSGGPDSLALTDVLWNLRQEWNLRVQVAHLDHMFRGPAAQADAAFVASFCHDQGIACIVRAVDVPAYAIQHGLSPEAAAREVRYAFLREVATTMGGAKIATAHHRGDQAETVLLHLLRGAGSRGLRGIQAKANGIIRPFLSLTRAEIEAYCQDRSLKPRFDASNAETEYTRNKIRLELLPELQKKYNPAIEAALCRSARLLGDEHDFIHDTAAQIWQESGRVCDGEAWMDRQFLCSQHTAMQREILRLALEAVKGDLKGIGFLHLEQLLRFCTDGAAGSVLQLPQGLRARCHYGSLVISGQREEATAVPFFSQPLQIPGRTILSVADLAITADFVGADQRTDQAATVICDADKIIGNVSIRQRQPGDRFSPSGLKGSKKLKDFFIDAKIARERRDGILLFCDEEKIFWVGGYRQDETTRVTAATTRFLRLRIESIHKEEKSEES